MIDSSPIRERFAALSRHLSERDRRLWAASEARAAGYAGHRGGVGGDRHCGQRNRSWPEGIGKRGHAGCRPGAAARRRVQTAGEEGRDFPGRLAGAGRSECARRSDVPAALDLQKPVAVGGGLGGERPPGRPHGGRELLHQQKFSLQANRKTREGDSHPDRDAQFVHINDTVAAALAAGEPVISVDTKKKELVGDFKNAGREWRPAGQPQDVRVHDFLIKELGRAVPYGVYDLADDAGWVSVGMDHDPSAFAVQSIRRWWVKSAAPDTREPRGL